jgi:hypothetical protein
VTDYIGAPPAENLIPVTRGCDRAFTIQRTNSSGTPVNFDSGTQVYLWVDIDRTNPTKVNGVVSGSTAAITISDAVCDQVKTGTRWRAVLDVGDLEIPLLVGRFERHDG